LLDGWFDVLTISPYQALIRLKLSAPWIMTAPEFVTTIDPFPKDRRNTDYTLSDNDIWSTIGAVVGIYRHLTLQDSHRKATNYQLTSLSLFSPQH